MGFEISFNSLYHHLIKRWYLLAGAGLVGALCASLIVYLAPKKYQAEAVVMVDQQVELAVPPSSPVDDVLYISRETVRLEELSYSDSLWNEVVDMVDTPEFEADLSSAGDLREWVRAPHYQDGAWYFMAQHSDPAFAAALANAWAESFVATVQTWIDVAQEEHALQAQIDELAILQADSLDECAQLEWVANRVGELRQTTLSQAGIPQEEIDQAVLRLRQLAFSASLASAEFPPISTLEEANQYSQIILIELEEEVLACHARLESLQVDQENLVEQLTVLYESSHGVSPYLRIQFSRSAGLPARPSIEIGNAALAGFIVAMALWIMADVLGFYERTSRSDRAES